MTSHGSSCRANPNRCARPHCCARVLVRRLQVHHAMCEMLTDVLLPLIRSNQPQSCTGLSPGLLAEWYNTVLRLKNEVGQWVNKHGKHTNVGCMLLESCCRQQRCWRQLQHLTACLC